MNHPFLKLALFAGAAFLIAESVKKTKEAQAKADAALAEQAVADAMQEDGKTETTESN